MKSLALLLGLLCASCSSVLHRPITFHDDGLIAEHKQAFLAAIEIWQPCYPFAIQLSEPNDPRGKLHDDRVWSSSAEEFHDKYRDLVHTGEKIEDCGAVTVLPGDDSYRHIDFKIDGGDSKLNLRKALHELGHALPGFEHDEGGIMNAPMRELTQDNMNHFCGTYGLTAPQLKTKTKTKTGEM